MYCSPSSPDQYGCRVTGLVSPGQVMYVPLARYGMPAGIDRMRAGPGGESRRGPRASVEAASALTVSRAKKLLRQLAEAPADLHIETMVDGQGAGPRGTLERLRPEPGDLLPRDAKQITGFRLSLFKSMGSTRGNAETGFIRSVDGAVDRFHSTVIAPLEPRPTRRPQPIGAEVAAAG